MTKVILLTCAILMAMVAFIYWMVYEMKNAPTVDELGKPAKLGSPESR